MQWLVDLLNGPNGILILILLILILILLIVLVKNGVVTYRGHGLTIGSDAMENERRIIRQQIQYIATKIDSATSDFPKEFDQYRLHYVNEKLKDMFENMIIFNHITNDDEYVSEKCEIAYNIVLKDSETEFFRTPQFKEFMYKNVSEVIERLVKIRKTYTNEK